MLTLRLYLQLIIIFYLCVCCQHCATNQISDNKTEEEILAEITKDNLPPNTYLIDLEICGYDKWSENLPHGHVWWNIAPSKNYCNIWLGGETENPEYAGQPTLYCKFKRKGEIKIKHEPDGGPAYINSKQCVWETIPKPPKIPE